jgi:hypothetical protein
VPLKLKELKLIQNKNNPLPPKGGVIKFVTLRQIKQKQKVAAFYILTNNLIRKNNFIIKFCFFFKGQESSFFLIIGLAYLNKYIILYLYIYTS